MSLAFLFHYLPLNMFRMLVHPSSGVCDLLWIYFMDCIATPPQLNHTVTPTHIEPEQFNTWNKSTRSRKLLRMDVLTFVTCWAVNSEIIKQVTSSLFVFIQLNMKFCFQHYQVTIFCVLVLKYLWMRQSGDGNFTGKTMCFLSTQQHCQSRLAHIVYIWTQS